MSADGQHTRHATLTVALSGNHMAAHWKQTVPFFTLTSIILMLHCLVLFHCKSSLFNILIFLCENKDMLCWGMKSRQVILKFLMKLHSEHYMTLPTKNCRKTVPFILIVSCRQIYKGLELGRWGQECGSCTGLVYKQCTTTASSLAPFAKSKHYTTCSGATLLATMPLLLQ